MAERKTTVKFKTRLARFDTEFNWFFIPVERKHVEKLRFSGRSRRAVCTLNEEESLTFHCALMPHADEFFIMVNKKIRTTLGIDEGDVVRVFLEKDTSKYGMPMPAEFEEVLKQDPEGDRVFHELTPGKQRSILYYVGKIKDIDKRIHTALIYVEHLKDNDGKIVYEKLKNELKRPLTGLL